MCLLLKENKKKRASKDLYTIKYLKIKSNIMGELKLHAPYRYEFNYDLKKLYKTKLSVRNQYVNEGFHSYYNTNMSEEVIWDHKITYFDRQDYVIALCKIPKGSTYMIGIWSDVVSTQIIIEDIIFTPKKYKYDDSRKGIKSANNLIKLTHQYLQTNYPNNLIK